MFSSLIRSIWLKIDEPRVHRFLVLIRYLLAIVLGVTTLLATRRFEETQFGILFLNITGWMFIVSGTMGATNAWTRRWVWERPGTMLAMSGSVSGVGIEIYSLTLPNQVSGANWVLLVLFMMHFVSMLDRYIEIINDDYEIPKHEIKEAADKALGLI